MLYWLVPRTSSLKRLWVFMKLQLDVLQYNVWDMFDKLGCDTIYEVKYLYSFLLLLLSLTSPPPRTRLCARGAATACRASPPRWCGGRSCGRRSWAAPTPTLVSQVATLHCQLYEHKN